MPTKPNRKQPRNAAARKADKPRRAPNGRFKGQPRTLSETVMPEELAGPATEAPREVLPPPDTMLDLSVLRNADLRMRSPPCDSEIPLSMSTDSSSLNGQACTVEIPPEVSDWLYHSLTYRRPWYRRLWDWLIGQSR